jgi:hypothetical protein
LLVILTIATVFVCQSSVFAATNNTEFNSVSIPEGISIDIDSEELKAIAAKYADIEQLTGDELIAHDLKVNAILNNRELSPAQKEDALSLLGVYPVSSSENTVQFAASAPGNVSLGKPSISYDSSSKQYIITAYGNWTSHKYEVPTWTWWYPSVGSTKNIGGLDGIGISLSNTSGTTSGLAINSGYGYFHNGTATQKVTTMSSNSDLYGAGYKVQDFIKFTKVDNYVFWVNTTYLYNAYNMDCVLKYNAKFEGYNGSAKLFYGHTWDSTNITSIGVNKTGASIGWSTTSNHWDSYSYARTFTKGKQTN